MRSVGEAFARAPNEVAIDPARAASRLVHEGTAYFVCTLGCAGEFAREPEHVID